MRDCCICSVWPLLALLALLLASLLLLAPALLLAFLTLLLLASATSKSTDKPLSLVGYSSHSVLYPLHSLPGLVGYLACGFLCSPPFLLLRPATLGLRGA